MKILLQVLQLIPVIIEIIKSLEEAIPVPQQGKAKLDAILDIITQVSGGLSNELIPGVTRAISVIVGLFNATGVFKK